MTQKTIAGYHLLMILSAVDGKVSSKEDKIIRRYLDEHFTPRADLDAEYDLLINMDESDYAIQFNNSMNEFYLLSTPEERTHFLDLAVKLVIADKTITPRENLFLNELFNAWEANFSF
jgi:uncharacterized tellurite resistance protein B-like protein